VELTCIVCGKKFQRRQKDYNDFMKRVVTRGRYGPRCSRACVQSVSRTCSWCGQSVGLRPPSDQGQHAFCGKSRDCWREAMKLVQPVHWHLLEPEMLPMRDHVERIADVLGADRLTGGKSKRG
jgi:hypothetical protein